MRSLFCVFCLINALILPASSHASLLQPSCASELDGAVDQHRAGNLRQAKSALEKMLEQCAHLPQVHHNLGVIAGLQSEWQLAESYFKRAIADDSRTSMTAAHLQSMHQYRATQAYQRALNIKKRIAEPDFQMQDSAVANASYQAPPKTDQHNVPTVEYELYAWWTAAAQNELSAWLEHYTYGYPPMENNDAATVSWNDVSRDISFTAQDAVVVLSYQQNNVEKRTLLLLRLQNNRWKIYREALL